MTFWSCDIHLVISPLWTSFLIYKRRIIIQPIFSFRLYWLQVAETSLSYWKPQGNGRIKGRKYDLPPKCLKLQDAIASVDVCQMSWPMSSQLYLLPLRLNSISNLIRIPGERIWLAHLCQLSLTGPVSYSLEDMVIKYHYELGGLPLWMEVEAVFKKVPTLTWFKGHLVNWIMSVRQLREL